MQLTQLPFQVHVRVRNQIPKPNNTMDISILDKNTLRFHSDGTKYTKFRELQFQRIFDSHETNETVFQETLQEQMSMLYRGYNLTVLCYGMTGSGKTHTMFGMIEHDQGLVYRAVQYLFTQRNSLQDYKIRVSFFEIYNETINDLLSPQKEQHLSIQENKNGEINIPGLEWEYVQNESQLVTIIENAQARRSLAPTAHNQHSSRSHAIIQIQLCTYDKLSQTKYQGKLIMVDLAGSERCYYYNQNAMKLHLEGQNINKSLLALGQCISILNTNQTKQTQKPQYIPYRNSKLTRILKQSLGGNSLTIFIACISLCKNSLEETENTLKYAMKACQIKQSITQTFTNDTNIDEIEMDNMIIHKEPLTERKQPQFSEIAGIENKIREFQLNNLDHHKQLKILYKQIENQGKLIANKQSLQNYEHKIIANMKEQKTLMETLQYQQFLNSELYSQYTSNTSRLLDINPSTNKNRRTNSAMENIQIPSSKRFNTPFQRSDSKSVLNNENSYQQNSYF